MTAANIDEFLNFTLPELGNWIYWIVFLMTFLETSAFIGLIAPGEVTLLIAGLLASQEIVHLWGLIIAASLGAILGDNTGYWIGRRGGLPLLRRYGKYFFFREKHLAATQKYFQSHGGKTLIIGRFISVIKVFIPISAGISHMPYGRFLAYEIAGAILSVTAVLVLGFFFGESWRLVKELLGWGGAVAFVLVIAGGAAAYFYRRWRRKTGRH